MNRELPRLTDAMIRAACKTHYGDDNIDGIDGIDMTSHDVGYNFRQAFQRMWAGVRTSLRTGAPSASLATQEVIARGLAEDAGSPWSSLVPLGQESMADAADHGLGTQVFWFARARTALRLLATKESAAPREDVEALAELLTEVRDNGLIYWEPNTDRGYVAKAGMLARIDAALSRRSDRA